MLRMLVQACCFVGDSNGACRVQAVIDRLGFIALVPLATALMQGSLRHYEYGVGGEGDADARQLCLELCQQMVYKPQLQAVPWGFLQRSRREQQDVSLQLHAEKKALAVLLSHG